MFMITYQSCFPCFWIYTCIETVPETEMEIEMDISSKLHGQITYSLNLEPSFIIYQIGVPNNGNKGPSERRGGSILLF